MKSGANRQMLPPDCFMIDEGVAMLKEGFGQKPKRVWKKSQKKIRRERRQRRAK